MSKSLVIKKTAVEEDQRLVFAEVYAPDRPDSYGDFIKPAEIKKMAYKFMKNMNLANIDVMHDNSAVKGAHVVESFIAREDDPIFIPGSWVVGVHVDHDETWAKIKAGELNGFSLEALALTEDVEVEIEIPPVLSGDTSKDEDHVHKFYVAYDEHGNFLGGRTDVHEGHFHLIKAGTITEDHDGHHHKFSAVDDIQIVG